MASDQLNDRAVRTWLEEHALPYDCPQQGIYYVPIPGTERHIRIGLAPTVGAAVFMMALTIAVPMNRKRQAVEYANTLNAEEPMGAWLINMQTGEIIFRAALPLSSSNPADIWYLMRRVTTRVGGRTEAGWSRVLGLAIADEPDLPEWAGEE